MSRLVIAAKYKRAFFGTDIVKVYQQPLKEFEHRACCWCHTFRFETESLLIVKARSERKIYSIDGNEVISGLKKQ